MENDCIVPRIKHVLCIYPGISPSMLQLSITLPAQLWKPVLQDLIAQNQIIQETMTAESPGKRIQNYTKLFWNEQL